MRIRIAQRLAGLALAALGVAGVAWADGAPCQGTPGACQGVLSIFWGPSVVPMFGCTENCGGGATACAQTTDNAGNAYCYCPSDLDANHDGFVDSVLCSLGWQWEPGVGVTTQCVTVIGCAPLHCLQDRQTTPNGMLTVVICCCK